MLFEDNSVSGSVAVLFGRLVSLLQGYLLYPSSRSSYDHITSIYEHSLDMKYMKSPMGVQPLYGTGPHPLLPAGSWAAGGRMTICGILDCFFFFL